MSVWTTAQIRSVRRLFATITMIEWELEREGVRDAAKDELVKYLGRLAHSYAVEIDGRDVVIEERPSEERKFHVEVVGHWAPSTKQIELNGGEQDGQRLVWERHPDPIKIPRRSSMSLASFVETTPVSSYSLDHDTYEVSGWSETDRVWVYAAT